MLTVANYGVATFEPKGDLSDSEVQFVLLMKWVLLILLNAFSLVVGAEVISKIEITNQEIRELEKKIKEWEEQDSV